MEEGAVCEEQTIAPVNKAAWFAAFSVVIFALAIVAAIALVIVRRKKYMAAVKNKHSVNNVVNVKNRMYVTHHIVNAFQILLIAFFVAAVVMFMPYCYYSDGSFGHCNWGKAFMAAFHGTLRTFVLDGEYDIVAEFTAKLIETNAAVGWFYIVWSWVIYVFAPVFSTGIILTLFKNALSYLRYRLRFFVKQIYIMSELNEKSLALAEDIILNDRQNRGFFERLFFGHIIVFADVFEKNEEENYELVAQARSLGAKCVKRDITEISLRKAKTLFGNPRKRKIYLISENEDENVDHGLKIIDRCIKAGKYNNRDTELYIFSCGAESATLIDTAIADGCDMKVRRVDDNHNLILKFLWDNSIFEHAGAPDPETGERTLHAVIVGLGGYGMDILRMLCWFAQMPGFRLEVDVFDGENGSEKFKHISPELYRKNRDVTDGEPHYSIEFHDNVMYGTSRFDDEISALNGVSAVFCTLGEDEENIACSMDMRMLFGRTGEYVDTKPKIYTVVYKPQLSRKLTTRNKDDYGIDFLGGIFKRFTDAVIEQNDIEAYGRLINLEYTVNGTVWDLIAANVDFGKPEFKAFAEKISKVDGEIFEMFKAHDDGLSVSALGTKIDNIQDECIKIIEDIKGCVSKDISAKIDGYIASTHSYDKFEYNRRSSITRALYVRWLVALYCTDSDAAPYNDKLRRVLGVDDCAEIDKALAKNEHCRWSAYTRSIGYVLGGRKDIFKTHNTLVPFDSLPEGNKFKDRPIGALCRYIPLGARSASVSEDK